MVAFGEDGLDVRALAMLGLLAAVGAVLRPLSAGTAGIETVLVLLVLGGRVFGAGFGFLLGSTTLFAFTNAEIALRQAVGYRIARRSATKST